MRRGLRSGQLEIKHPSLQQKDMTAETLMSAIEKVMLERDDLVTKMQALGLSSATEKVKRVIESFLECKDVKKKLVTE